ncbi:MAG TPA: phosphoenolpyruvate carboxykinase (ATP) [Gaiellaceae bacterium]|nr:phosphoenolpyruvate carboxykinase (ATP) [Gaiellaceae bacterium]
MAERLALCRRRHSGRSSRDDAGSPLARGGHVGFGPKEGRKIAITTETPLARHGLNPDGPVYWQPTTALLYAHALAREEGKLAEGGPLVVDTGRFTGRSPKDKFVVREPGSEERIWWGTVNQPLEEENFDGLRAKVIAHLDSSDLYVVDAFAGADPAHRIGVRVITGRPYHALFAKTMFIEPTADELEDFEPEALVLHAPEVEADPAADGTRTEVFVVLHPGRTEVLIGGTFYGGEIKKSIFTVMNDRLPLEGVFPMHCSANVDDQGRVAIFFGLSGTGKTTLSADPERSLIGDDEHGWGDSGVFNIEGGCYAKVIRLSAEAEPEIYKTTHTFGTILENVTIDESGVLDLDDDSKTENTRAAYKLEQIGNALPTKQAGHPSAIVMLTADAFGILPPIARLTRDQALFYFLSGYTAKVAGTEIGVTEPQATFSTCFGSPFLPQEPAVYARMLGEKLDEQPEATVWLVNTGWTGGPFGEGHRMPIAATRGLLRAALEDELRDVEYRTDPIFGFEVPVSVPGVDQALLDPRSTWNDVDAYDRKARELARMFRDNFEEFADSAGADVTSAGPRI